MTSSKKISQKKSPIKGVSLKEIDTVKNNLPPKKVINSFFKDLVSSNKKHSDEKKMELPEFCNYLNKHVSKRELREICQIINIPFYEDEKPSDTCIRIENSAGYIMSPKHINILKVLAKYSAYIIGVLGLLYLSSRNGKLLNLSDNSGDNFSALTFSDRNKASWRLFKDSLKSLKFLFYPEFLEYRGMEYETVQYLNEPILLFLAKFTATFGFLSLISNTLRTLGMSKIRHQVFQVLGKDTRESKGENRKRTIKKK